MKNKILELVLSLVLELRLPVGSKILDVGCGTGELSSDLSDAGYKVTGIDISSAKIITANEILRRGKNIPNFQLGNVEDLEFDDNYFDIILAINTLDYVTWQRWALQEMRRVLKPGGYLLIISTNRLSMINLLNPAWYLKEIKAKIKGKVNRNNYANKKDDNSDRDYSPKPQLGFRIKKNLELVGYQIIIYDSIGFGSLYSKANLNEFKTRSKQLHLSSVKENGISNHNLLGNELIFLAKKRIKSADINQHRFFQDTQGSVHNFVSEHAKLFDQRRQWLDENPTYQGGIPDNIESIIGDGERILVVSPHPDDELIGCGGTLIKLLNQGKQVTVLQLTDGRNTAAFNNANAKTRTSGRLLEAIKVSEYMGFSKLLLWELPDNQIRIDRRNITRFQDVLGSVKPQIIFTPFVNDPHPDHRAANELLMNALQESSEEYADLIIMGYECWSMLPTKVISPITAEFEKKTTALMKYKIAMRVVDYVGFCENLNAYHHYNIFDKPGYAEAFFPTDVKTFTMLQKSVKRGDSIDG